MAQARTRKVGRIRRPPPIPPSLEHLGERLRKARSEAGLSQAQLAAPHFTRAYVSAIELGKIRPAMKSLEFMAGKLRKPAAYFLEDEEQSRRRRERDLEISAAAVLVTRPNAAKAIEKLMPLIETSTTPSEIARLRVLLGTAYNFAARPTEALRSLTIAERLARGLGDASLARATAHQLAIAHRLAGDHQRAYQLLTELLGDVERSQVIDQVLRMRLLKDLGAVSIDLGQPEKANAYYLAALEWAQDIGDVSGLIGIYNGLAYAYRALGDLEAATTYLQRALGATEVSNDLTAAAVMHNALAVLAAERGHVEAAYRHVDKAIEIARVNGPQAYVPHYLTTKAECALKTGRFEEARQVATDAAAAAKESNNRRAHAAALVVLGEVALQTGERDSGIRRLEEAAGMYRSLDARSELGEVLMRLSRAAEAAGDAESARQYAAKAYEATKTGSSLLGR